MNAEELKHELRNILGDQLEFNKEFDKYAESIKNVSLTLIEWCTQLKEGRIRPTLPSKRKDCVTFIKKIGSSNRCIIIKVKNNTFTEAHLADHTYYDNLRKKLGLKIDS